MHDLGIHFCLIDHLLPALKEGDELTYKAGHDGRHQGKDGKPKIRKGKIVKEYEHFWLINRGRYRTTELKVDFYTKRNEIVSVVREGVRVPHKILWENLLDAQTLNC